MYWAKEIAKDIISKRGKKINLATGITPSGKIHIGNMREVMTAELIKKELDKLGAKTRLIYIADDFDRLRKLYPFLPKKFEKYIGWPLSNIPDPEGKCHGTYAEHFLAPFFSVLEELGINVEKFSATKMYQDGFYVKEIKTALQNKEEIKKILKSISGRTLPDDWSPYNPLCRNCGKIDEAKVIEEDLENNKVKYKCCCGHIDWSDFSKGEGKLSWRIDWPARWSKIPVTFEPYGKEHATLGGSYDTGKAICEKVFNSDAPYGVGYDLIYLKGFKGKMSSSLGNVISADEFLEVVPPEILRFLFAKTKYDKIINFDPGMGLLSLVDEYSRLEQKIVVGNADSDEKEVYEACQIKRFNKSISPIPFKHLVNAVLASQGKEEEIKRIISNSGHEKALEDNMLFLEQVNRVKKWIDRYAPENVKFSLLQKSPKIKLSLEQKKLIKKIIDKLTEKVSGEDLHNFIYSEGKELGLKPNETFTPLYQSIIGKDHGPKAGWFLVILDRKFVIDRLNDIIK